eukprot:5408936-Pyramimonas_sp.AAC.1
MVRGGRRERGHNAAAAARLGASRSTRSVATGGCCGDFAACWDCGPLVGTISEQAPSLTAAPEGPPRGPGDAAGDAASGECCIGTMDPVLCELGDSGTALNCGVKRGCLASARGGCRPNVGSICLRFCGTVTGESDACCGVAGMRSRGGVGGDS